MLKIAVIEDNEVQSRLLKDYANEWANKNNLLPEIKLFSSGEQFWFEFEELSDIDIILLDIQMSRISGIELAKKIRKIAENFDVDDSLAYAQNIANAT